MTGYGKLSAKKKKKNFSMTERKKKTSVQWIISGCIQALILGEGPLLSMEFTIFHEKKYFNMYEHRNIYI